MNIKKVIQGFAINIPDDMLDKLPEHEVKNIKYLKDFESFIYSNLEHKRMNFNQFIFADTKYDNENSLDELEIELNQRFKDINIYDNAIFIAGVYK